jgi:hypothetical protein
MQVSRNFFKILILVRIQLKSRVTISLQITLVLFSKSAYENVGMQEEKWFDEPIVQVIH